MNREDFDRIYEPLDAGEFCCERMHREVLFVREEIMVNDDDKSPLGNIVYSPQLRKYGLLLYEGSWDDISFRWIDYCPFCGRKLPERLEEEDQNVFLRSEYGWTDDDCWGMPRRKLPPEFETDEWWKKREGGVKGSKWWKEKWRQVPIINKKWRNRVERDLLLDGEVELVGRINPATGEFTPAPGYKDEEDEG